MNKYEKPSRPHYVSTIHYELMKKLDDTTAGYGSGRLPQFFSPIHTPSSYNVKEKRMEAGLIVQEIDSPLDPYQPNDGGDAFDEVNANVSDRPAISADSKVDHKLWEAKFPADAAQRGIKVTPPDYNPSGTHPKYEQPVDPSGPPLSHTVELKPSKAKKKKKKVK